MNTRQVRPAALHTGRRGFTLIELLVVVSIIALLVAIMLPALGGAKDKARSAACQANLHGLGQAMTLYLNEADNTFPVNGILFPKANVPSMYLTATYGSNRFAQYEDTNMQHYRPEYGELWREMGGVPLLADPRKSRIFMCPSDLLNGYRGSNTSLIMDSTGQIAKGPGSKGYWSYSVNTVLNSIGRFRNNFSATGLPWTDPLKATSILNPSNFLWFIEEDDRVSSFNDEVFEPPAYRNAQNPDPNAQNDDSTLSSRHSNGGNVSFADGHVEWWNEILFNQGPSAGFGGGTPDNWTAMQHPVTRMFFPDGGAFATPP